jgi:hypothetical protein
VPPVQHHPVMRWSTLGRASATALAAGLVLLTLTVPSRLEDMGLGAFVRLPLEAIVYLAIVLAVPPHLARLRRTLAVAAGALLGVSAVFMALDIGFMQALNRPFDPLIDWRYAGSLVETVRGSAPGGLGLGMLVLASVLVVGLLVLLPLAVARVTQVAVDHRTSAGRVVAVLAAAWLALSVLDLGEDAGAVPSHEAAAYVYGQVSRVPSELRDQREFAEAAETDPVRGVPAQDLVPGLRGKDVVVVFVESYGRVAVEGSSVAPGISRILDRGTLQLEQDGFATRSAYLTSPTFGALSWLAHATLQSGLWIDSQQRYDHLVTSSRLTLSQLFGRAGWRTVAVVPANTRDWPQGAFYRFDHVYDSRNIGYRGPRFGYPTMPDQYTLDALHHLELAPESRRPVMAEVDLITSHAPWSRTPRMIPQAEVGDGSVYRGMPEQLLSEADIWPSPERVRAAYARSIAYSLEALVSFLTSYGDDDLVVVALGDHQPATIVSGEDPGRDVPVSVIARDPAVMDRVSGWGWTEGLRPGPQSPVWRMDAFRDRFLAAYGANGETGLLQASSR